MTWAKNDNIGMGRLKLLVSGRSQHTRARAKDRLFTAMMTQVLNHHGYRVDRILNTDPSELEMEIEGKHRETGIPVYAVSRFDEKVLSERDLQAFFGRYMIKWHEDKRCHGLLIAIPGFDDAAREFYQEYIEKNDHVTTFLFEEDAVLKAISEVPETVRPEQAAGRRTPGTADPDQRILLYTERGIFWALPIIRHGDDPPDRIALFDGKGSPVSDQTIVGYLTKLYPPLANFKNIFADRSVPLQPGLFQESDRIVEVKGSPACFDYKFPASPGHFVGRRSFLSELDSFVNQVIDKRTAQRGIIIEAPTGWGKSSIVLAGVEYLQKMGHFAVAIDCRTASSTTFIPCVIEYIMEKLDDVDERIVETEQPKPVKTFGSAVRSMLEMGHILESRTKLMLIFFDQFENNFFLPDVMKQIRDLFLKVVEKQTHIVLGFSWDKDLVLSSPAFSEERFEVFLRNSKKMVLSGFSGSETDAFLKKLGKEVDEPLTKDLRSFLIKFSRGYPWLLKALCFHVKVARQSGIPQPDIPEILLCIEELFQQELQDLTDTEQTTLHQIAKFIPGRPGESYEQFDPQSIQSLVNQGLVNRIGNTFDVSWNIFKDYLNTGHLPFRSQYLLDASVGQITHGITILHAAGGILDIPEFRRLTELSGQGFYDVAKDLDLLSLVRFSSGRVFLQLNMSDVRRDTMTTLRNHLRARFPRNRPISEILKTLKDKHILALVEISAILETLFPFTKITQYAWSKYARILAQWLDAADLALFDKKNRKLVYFDPATEIRVRNLVFPKRRGSKTPRIQYASIENMAIRLVHALQGDGSLDWTGLSKNTVFRSLSTLEDLGFILRKMPLIKILPRARAFVENPDKRPLLFAEGALQLASFSIFLEILQSKQLKGSTLLELGLELKKKLGENWKKSTSEIIAKIMLDWARHANLAPGVFAKIRKGPIKGWKKKEDRQMTLF